MDILEVLVDAFADGGVAGYEVCKAQTPGTPVSTNLTDDKLAFRLCFHYGLVYLLDGVDSLVIDLFQTLLRLDIADDSHQHEEQAGCPLYVDTTLFHSCGMLWF